jgi:hypothetical protein
MAVNAIRRAAGNRPDERNDLEHGPSPIKVECKVDTDGRIRGVRVVVVLNLLLTAQNVAREEALGAGIHAGPFGRIESAEQAEVFGWEGRETQERDWNQFAGRLWRFEGGTGFGRSRDDLLNAEVAAWLRSGR